VSWKDYKAVTADLKAIYQASTEDNALTALNSFCDQWDHQYPKIGESWKANWENIRTIFSYPAEIRHAIYTTNAIESLNSVSVILRRREKSSLLMILGRKSFT